nr:MAG TPA: tail completion protein [Caudoviricetes sp.]
MINSIIEGISISINTEFEDVYTIYTESVEQGLKEPCFFISCLNPTSKVFLGERYFRTNQMCIQYIPANKSVEKEDCNAVTERLFNCLEYITVGEDLIRGSKMNSEIVDGVLNFFVNYDLFTLRLKNKEDAMDEVLRNVAVKGQGE